MEKRQREEVSKLGVVGIKKNMTNPESFSWKYTNLDVCV